MTVSQSIRWGILSTAAIGRTAFLPALVAGGDGKATLVGGRDLARTQRFADQNGVERAVEGYQRVLDDDAIDAVYIPLPNGLHAEWTIRALQAGKAVLCEKPLTSSLGDTRTVLSVARNVGGLLWEAFVFPFREQTRQVRTIVTSGEIGDLRELQSTFHFGLPDRDNIRLSSELGGGSLMDVGCYCVAFARHVMRSDADGAVAIIRWAPEGVDEEASGVLEFPGERQLIFSCGMRRGSQDCFTRILGTEGEIRLTNPYHPGAQDSMAVRRWGKELVDRTATDEGSPSFTQAIEHIHRVLRGEEQPRHLATEDALGNALALDAIQRSAQTGERVAIEKE